MNLTMKIFSSHACRPAPGGCTIAGLLALEDGRVRSTIARAIQVATERASELGQPTTK
jgi:pyrroline-5-carboxylate reductase